MEELPPAKVCLHVWIYDFGFGLRVYDMGSGVGVWQCKLSGPGFGM